MLVAIALAAGLSVCSPGWSGLPAASLMLATAPGGIAEMCITAKVLQLGVPLVTAAHVTRVLVLVNATAPLYRQTRRRYLAEPSTIDSGKSKGNSPDACFAPAVSRRGKIRAQEDLIGPGAAQGRFAFQELH